MSHKTFIYKFSYTTTIQLYIRTVPLCCRMCAYAIQYAILLGCNSTWFFTFLLTLKSPQTPWLTFNRILETERDVGAQCLAQGHRSRNLNWHWQNSASNSTALLHSHWVTVYGLSGRNKYYSFRSKRLMSFFKPLLSIFVV